MKHLEGETKERPEEKNPVKAPAITQRKLATIRHDNSCHISQPRKQKCLRTILFSPFYALRKMHLLVGAPGEEVETLVGPSGPPPACVLGGSRVLLIHGRCQGLTGSEGFTEGAVTLFQDTLFEQVPHPAPFPCPRHSPS